MLRPPPKEQEIVGSKEAALQLLQNWAITQGIALAVESSRADKVVYHCVYKKKTRNRFPSSRKEAMTGLKAAEEEEADKRPETRQKILEMSTKRERRKELLKLQNTMCGPLQVQL